MESRPWIPDPLWGFADGPKQDAQVRAREALNDLAEEMAELILNLADGGPKNQTKNLIPLIYMATKLRAL